MLDPKFIRSNPDLVMAGLTNRGAEIAPVENFLSVDEEWRKLTAKIDERKARRNAASEQIAQLKKNKTDASKLLAEMKVLSDEIKTLEDEQKGFERQIEEIVMAIPNIPQATVPKGKDCRDNLQVRMWGEKRKFDFKPLPHDELGKKLDILDFDRAAKISGSRFVVYKGLGAALERALISFMLDLHIKENGYTEVMTPAMVLPESMRGTGQLPKFEEELFRCRDDELYLIPTAEVSVTNLYREEILPSGSLPIKHVAYSPCFRREAGSYGKDVKGIIRQHQFNKVELVKFVEPDKSNDELEKLTADAELVLKKLNLPYRIMQLCSGDLGFSAAKTYDIEVWFPSENQYREISSCSNFESFQARRANIRYRPAKDAKPEFVHTLNGSGLAVGRCFAAILENYQKADGTLEIPEVLKKYL
ncbi:serine--tRNA ligase [candidate division WOR-1 bacterium RIFCSPHIGHO2_01_FULL_53_15]|uniref:Serine--tRNA ligase n=1 Tax=candidate division WOR-1 bacterium RIFCSPHIGHO2_01_FULL_53_15 TaxID=1802564 RepID=A0A1F4Q042_UNCSA|nr:MAG: serine--tRNA ligase [candidate division WOR-1 bacterium RIFCSPHIGHO2_01_FULL_53_15]OGC12639.1 MAG: serine--tRNA ligase [candidate division WOR-1 bacterium RIFCSPHIGHO2_02_FULL_53_26]